MYVGLVLSYIFYVSCSLELVLIGPNLIIMISVLLYICSVENDICLPYVILLFFNANYSNDILARVSLKNHLIYFQFLGYF